MKASTRYFVISSALVTVVGIGSGLVAYYGGLPARAFAAKGGGPDELQYVPPDAAVVAYANVQHIMTSELRQHLKQAMPDGSTGQHEFESQTGINVETDIDHVVAFLEPSANEPSSGLVLAHGHFDQVKIESLMREHGAQVEQYGDQRVIVATPPANPRNGSASPQPRAPKQLALSFLEPGLVAIGSPALVRKAIDLKNPGPSIMDNDQMADRIRSLDSGTVWAVGRLDAIKTDGRLPGGMAQLPPITWFAGSGTINDGIDGVVRAETSSEETAKNLRDVVQGFVGLAGLQLSSKPDLKTFVESLQISGSGNTVALSFSVPGRVIESWKPGTSARKRESQAH